MALIRSRAKPHHVQKLLERLDCADAAICNAALTNTLTKSGDDWLRGILHSVRAFRDAAHRVAEARDD